MEIEREIDHNKPIKNPDIEERNYVMKDKLYKFLMGLNLEYETLGKDTSVLKKWNSKVPFIIGDPKTNPKAHLFCTYYWKKSSH
ncbi:unnamed protein product [Spirodela intermedia]|uniref:Uncharacterized protein n=1 Tax=Spirodela intermedia TaxID=51605 RepID=A0A7I8JTN5_SPIIN|nr:unnamed protein product [Spirodela intermedia]CAA6673464.1 unnamed protein product [Spirodela intermedia]